MEFWLDIPRIQVKKVFNADYDCTYYELHLNGQYEGRYQTISDIHWRIGLILSEEALRLKE